MASLTSVKVPFTMLLQGRSGDGEIGARRATRTGILAAPREPQNLPSPKGAAARSFNSAVLTES